MNLVKYNQPTAKPVAKMEAVGVAGAVATVLVFVLDQLGVSVPDVVIAAAVTILVFAAGYIKRDAKPRPVVDAITRIEQ